MSLIVESIAILYDLNEEDLISHYSELLNLSITISTKLCEIDPVLNRSTGKCVDLNAIVEATKTYHKLKTDVSQTLRRLEKAVVHNEVQLIHANYVDRINVIRDTRTAAVNSDGFSALTTQAALDSLFDSLQRNKEFQLKQICDLSMSIDDGAEMTTAWADWAEAEAVAQYSTSTKFEACTTKLMKMLAVVMKPISRTPPQQQRESPKIRRDGIVCLSPRSGGDGGLLCYVQDMADNQRRACALRTLVDIQGALSGLARKQKWAMLGGEVDGLNGETAIAVRLTVSTPVQQQDEGLPIWINSKHLHWLCIRCGDFNLEKRLQTSKLEGCVCLVTGGRVRIGYQICLKLLRAGATVITTTRWPKDAALRYSHEHDFNTWRDRLRIDELELSDPEKVEEYCQGLLDGIDGRKKLERLHVLINNAAQTITRPSNWFVKMKQMEVESLPLLKFTALSLITNGISVGNDASTLTESGHDSGIPVSDSGNRRTVVLDESGQPLDLSGVNSWSRRLVDVSREELISTMNVNAVAPFIFMRNAGLVVNVTALEGKFNVGKKSSGHPHTNMAKAALNMLTLTCAREWARSSVYVSSVDTGWVTDMAPGGVGASSLAHETFIGPPLDDEDGAARVLDPVFSYANSQGDIKMFGHFYKDYMKASW
eukprot:gene26302-34929_t